MQKTTVMLDEELLQAAMNVIQARTKREAIIAGLEALGCYPCSVQLSQPPQLHQQSSCSLL